MRNNENLHNETTLNEVVKILQNDNGGEIDVRYNLQQIYFEGETNELMIRNNAYHKELVIARISLNHKRKGTGLKILNALKLFAIENKYERIVAESVLTEEFRSFLYKHGFTEIKGMLFCYELKI